MRDGDGGILGPPKAYHIPSMPTTDPVASAYDREHRHKMFAITKAAFPDLNVPMPFVSVWAKKEAGFSMPFVCASVIVKSMMMMRRTKCHRRMFLMILGVYGTQAPSPS